MTVGRRNEDQVQRRSILAVLAPALYADNGHSGFTAALRNCTELIGFGPAPFTLARALVPNSFSLVAFNGSAGLVTRASRCESVAVDGSSPRPAIVVQVGIAVIPPDGSGDINNYTLLYATDHEQLAHFLNQAGLPAVLDRALVFQFTPDSSGHGELYAAVSPGPHPAWFLTGEADPPPAGGAPVVANWWFDGTRGGLKMATAIPSISYGTANFSLHTSKLSVLGELIGGNTDASFVFFNARGAFGSGNFSVTVR